MKIGRRSAKVFAIKNRKGYAVVCCDHLTEGRTKNEAVSRMIKALNRTDKKKKTIKKAK